MIRYLFMTAAILIASVGFEVRDGLAVVPSVTASRTSAPIGAPVTLTGTGFIAGETVYIEIAPVDAPEGKPIGKVAADSSGSFTATFTVGIAYPGPEYPPDAPVGGGESINFPPGPYTIIAYPDSFGLRTQASLAQAPKVAFQVTVGQLPETGGAPAPGGDPTSVLFAAGLMFLVLSLAAFGLAARRSSPSA